MTAFPEQLTQIDDTRLRLQLMLAWESLCAAGVVRRALSSASWDALVRAAAPEERPGVVTAILAAEQEDARFPARLADGLVALAVYEADDEQLGRLAFLAPWTPDVTRAISERSATGHTEIPAAIRAQGSWQRQLSPERPVETSPAMILAEPDPDAAAELVDAYQSLWAWGVIDEALEPEILGRTLDHLVACGDLGWAERLADLVPGARADGVLEHRADGPDAFDLSSRRTQPRITGSYAAVPAAARFRRRPGRARATA